MSNSTRRLAILAPIRDAYVVYEGPSALNGAPIVAVITGVARASKNAKTGPMAQMWILAADERPTDAQRTGGDESVCGLCPFRPKLRREALAAGKPAQRYACYVNTGRAPNKVHAVWADGRYGKADLVGACSALTRAGRSLRLGAYGDPAAVPGHVLSALTAAVSAAGQRWTAYTHQWRNPAAQGLSAIAMASCETPTDVAQAEALGWRAFVVIDGGKVLGATGGRGTLTEQDKADRKARGKRKAAYAAQDAAAWLGVGWASHNTVACPNVTHGTSCADCGLCDGRRNGKPRAHVAIAVHV